MPDDLDPPSPPGEISPRWGEATPPPAAELGSAQDPRPATPVDPWVAPPRAASDPARWSAPVAPTARRWRSMKGLGVALSVLLWLAFAGLAVSLVLLVAERNAARDVIEDGRVVNFDLDALRTLDDATGRVDAVGALLLLLSVATFVLLVIFLWRGATNAEMLGRTDPPLSSGWAIGAWFIPMASVILVPIVFSGVWKGLDPTVAPGSASWRRARASALVVWWWLSYCIGAAVYMVGSSLRSEDETGFLDPGDFTAGIDATIVGVVLLLVATLLCLQMVRAITRRADTWADHLASGSAPTAASRDPEAAEQPPTGFDDSPPPPPLITG